MSLLDEIPKDFTTMSKKLTIGSESQLRLDELRNAVQLTLDKNNIKGTVIQMLYDFRDNMLIFKINKE